MDKEELLKNIKNCKSQDQVKKLLDSSDIELSDEELDSVSGGWDLGVSYNSGEFPSFCQGQIVHCMNNRVQILKVLDKKDYGNSGTDYYGNAFFYKIEFLESGLANKKGDIKEVPEAVLYL